jgi:hypothetical protein
MTVVSVHVALIVVTLLKGKIVTGFLAMFLPLLAFVGVVRLAKPHSLWARLFYKSGSRKALRAEERQRKHDARWDARTKRVLDVIGGAPSAPETD